MKKIITFLVLFSSIVNTLAQETVTNRSGKEITVNSPATTTTQGQVKLAGDLGGTADLPTVPALSTKIDGSGTINYIPKFTAAKTLGNSLLFDNGTNVGLGTVTPVSKFEVSDAAETFIGNGTLRISNNTTPTVNNFAGSVFKSNNVTGETSGSWKIGSNQETTTASDQNFHFLNSSLGSQYASKMTLTPSGNVGIGTTAPANKLEITQGTAGNSGLRFTNLNSSSTASTSSSKVLALNSTGDVILTNVPGTQNIVDFSTATPTTSGVVFTPNTPADESVVYQSSIDNSMWTYNGSAYVTYNASASTAWYTSGTTSDAGNSKTSNIWRTGNVGIGTSSTQFNPSVPLDVQTSLVGSYITVARFIAPSNITAGNATQLTFGAAAALGNSSEWRYIYQGNNLATNRVDFGMSGYATPMISYLNNGNVGIGTTGPTSKLGVLGSAALGSYSNLTAPTNGLIVSGNVGIGTSSPSTTLHVQNSLVAQQAANTDAAVLRLSRPIQSGVKWDNIAQFNLGSYVSSVGSPIDSKSRLDLALTNAGDATTLTKVMTWQANGNVGINTTSPSAPLVVQTNAVGTGVLKLAAPSVAGGDNWWMGFSHGINNSPDSNDRARIGVDILTGGSGRLFFTTGAPGSQTRAMFIDQNQRVGIGTSNPTSTLEINGSATNTVAFNSGSATAILFNNSNLAYTSASPTAFFLQGIKDGGTYTLAVQGTTSGTASFTAAGFTFKSINNGTTIAGKDTLYTFVVMGTTVYVYMATGF